MLYIEGKQLNHLEDMQYIVIKIEKNIWSGKSKYYVDVGQSADLKSQLTTEDGKTINFRSEVDAMNYLFHKGWGYITTNFMTNPNTGGSVHQLVFTKRSS